MANTSADDVAELKQELAQFLLTEITSVQGAQTFRKEVSAEVAQVIDQALNDRLTPALQRIESQAAEQANALTARVDAALRRFEQEGAPAVAPSPEIEQKIAELTARLDEMRARLARSDEQGRRAVAQPIAAPKMADERIAVTPKNTSAVPRWALWVIILMLTLTALAIGNIYFERMRAPVAASSNPAAPPASGVASKNTPATPAPALSSPTHSTPAPLPVSVPPQNPPSNSAVTPTPASNPPAPPAATPSPPPAQPRPAHAIPAEFAIERGWLAAQPFAVEGMVARRAGASGHITTLKSLVCGRTVTCTADALFGGAETTKFIALQMLMSQIGDRFCSPRRAVHVSGDVSDSSLRELANVTRCAGLRTAGPCREGDNRVCLSDGDMIEAGDVNALTQLLRWALWKTGST